MPDTLDAPTHACDQCHVPVALTALVPVGKRHLCRHCAEEHERAKDGLTFEYRELDQR